MDVNDDYVRSLEQTISKFMVPLRNIQFPIVIKAISGHSVIPFNKNDKDDVTLLNYLRIALKNATKAANQEGIFTNRPNEVGNHIEPFVRDALNQVGLSAKIPRTRKGIHKAAGYPDIEIRESNGRMTYLECKTYNPKSEDSSFRAFYLQPSEDVKITSDARHLLVGFEVRIGDRRSRPAYIPTKWRLYTLDNLRVQVKYEFNASNRVIYEEKSLLAQGGIGE